MITLNKNILIGALITVSGSFAYVLMSFISKNASEHLSITALIFLQSVSGLLCASLFLKRKNYSLNTILKQNNILIFIRTLMCLLSLYTFVYGLKYVSIFNALVVLNAAPLLIPFLRKGFFKKSINALLFIPILVAFSGIIFILSPDKNIFSLPILMLIVSMVALSFSLLILEVTTDIDQTISVFYYFLYSSIILGSILLWQYDLSDLTLPYIGVGAGTGILFFLVQLSIVYAARYISPQFMSVLFYSEVILSFLCSMVFEGIHLTPFIFLGIVFVIIGGACVTLFEEQDKSPQSAGSLEGQTS